MPHREPDSVIAGGQNIGRSTESGASIASRGKGLASAPPPERWEEWNERAPAERGERLRRSILVPTTCDGCSAACGLLAWVDRERFETYRLEGNPLHPSSRGRACAWGLATLDRVRDPDRILTPLRRKGARGEGRWEPVPWDEALDEVAARMRRAIEAERVDDIVVHLGQPEPDPFAERLAAAWGLDLLLADTASGSPGAATGYQLWMGADRVGVDFESAALILLIGGPRDGSPMLPDPLSVISARRRGARVYAIDQVRRDLAAHADQWIAPFPGTEGALLLAVAQHLIRNRAYNRDFIRRWWNWHDYMVARHPGVTASFQRFELALQKLYAHYSFDYAERECGVPAAVVAGLADAVVQAGPRLAIWCGGGPTEGNLGGWQLTRIAFLLSALVGGIGGPGGVSPGDWWRFLPEPASPPPAFHAWNSLIWPERFPLAAGPASALLPHLLAERGRGLALYVADRVNPVGAAPDGFSWLAMLRDETQVEGVVAMTPHWTETAWFADLVLPVGYATEAHSLRSAATYDGQWISLQQPVLRTARALGGTPAPDTRATNPAEVWEPEELWAHLAWRLDPDGAWGMRDAFASRMFRGEQVGADEYYSTMLERSVPALSEQAGRAGLSAVQYLRQRGAFELRRGTGAVHEQRITARDLTFEPGSDRAWSAELRREDARNRAPVGLHEPDQQGRRAVGVRQEGEVRRGFSTPSGRLEFYSPTVSDWGWPEAALPGYIKSHVHRDVMHADEFVLVPLFDPPQPAGALALEALAHLNPLWIHPEDAARIGLATGDVVRVETEIGHFVTRAWLTGCIRAGVVGCATGRTQWRPLGGDPLLRRRAAGVSLHTEGNRWSVARETGIRAYSSENPDTDRIWWTDTGTPANLALPVHPDPLSGAHCWYQAVRVRPAQRDDVAGDASADLDRAGRVAAHWMARTRRAEEVSPDRTRRPSWMIRIPRPTPAAWALPEERG